METSKLSAVLFILMLFISTSFHIACACNVCPTPTTPKAPKEGPIIVPPIIGKPPIVLPPIIGKPPVTVPPITLPPVIGKPPITLPPVIVKPPITLPPVVGKPPIISLPPIITLPPIVLPPVIGIPLLPAPPETGTPGCPPPEGPVTKTCPVDTIKLGEYLVLLGNVLHIGDPAVKKFCPLISGLVGLEAAHCLCTTIKLKLLNLNVFLPIALELLVTCGKEVPPGYTCP